MSCTRKDSIYRKKRTDLLQVLKSEIEIHDEYFRINGQNISYIIKSSLGTFTGIAKFTDGDDYNEMVGKNLAKTRAYRTYNMEVGVYIENNYIRILNKQMNHYKGISESYKNKEQRIQNSIDKYYERKNG